MVLQQPCGKKMEEAGMSTPDPHRPNTRATYGGIALVVVLLALGVWVFNGLDASQKAQNCIESGGRRCAAIDTDALPRK